MDNYIWLIPVLPLAGFIINGLGRNVLPKTLIGLIASILVFASFGLKIDKKWVISYIFVSYYTIFYFVP